MKKPKGGLSVRTVIRSAGVGAFASIVDFAVLATLVSGLGMGPRSASPIALGSGLIFQFVGNKLFAFEDTRKRWGRQAGAFVLVEAFAFVANLALYDVAVRYAPLPYWVLRPITQAIVYFGFCLPLWSTIFEQRPANASSKEVAS